MSTPTDDSGRKPRISINPPVFYGSAGLLLLLVLYVAMFEAQAQSLFSSVQDWIIHNVGWFYVLAVAVILLITVFCMISRYGDIKLGPDDSSPDYSNSTWFAMLFCAGMGIGLMFFGVAEPLMHMIDPPFGEPYSALAAREAIKITFFHWGLHAWAIYAIVALILAYFAYRHGLPLTLRSALYPLIGERIYGPIGHAADIFAVLGTVIGIATSLGFGVLQINSGFNHLFGLAVTPGVQVILIIVTMGMATLSVVSGLDKGIRRLSELNMVLAVALMLFVLLLGPTVFLIQAFVQNTGAYLSEIVGKTFNLYAYDQTDWLGGWTLFYWGWWLSWSPFVGMFIARISRGRTIREFVAGVIFMPTAFTFLWMTVFGDSAIDMVLNQGFSRLADVTQADNSLALFVFLEQFPFARVLSGVAVAMVIVFFVTSADSGALVVDMLASGGNDNAPVWQRIFWAAFIALIAIVLLLSDGLGALQTATIASALPYGIVLLAAIWGLLKALQLDVTKRATRGLTKLAPRVPGANEDWRHRLRNLMTFPRRSHVQRFLSDVVAPACQDVAGELRKQGSEVNVTVEPESVRLEVLHGAEVDFIYEVAPKAYAQPAFALVGMGGDDREERKYFRAEVSLKEGGQNYDIMGWSRAGVISDILDQYEKHLHFLHLVR
ncbi:BCCT family transporter [Verticiella sediminum]|uniref:BCCT family transporter n=1 Tax=Verticiella sediminum TaxID=1247510 RepID=A0A556AFC5_9BURK|nr:choline BCCT transporter BetT [Verticiella sediminum]TSH91594.1 BCCT family transporter [Verticiella sediminum]